MNDSPNILENPIEFLKGVGPKKGDLLKKEIGVFTFRDLLMQFPFRYVDKTKFNRIRDINVESETVQVKGILRRIDVIGEGRKRRLVGRLRDETGVLELVWFKGVHWLEKNLNIGGEYVVFGKINNFRGHITLPHPEIEPVSLGNTKKALSFAPVYPSTEKLNAKGLDAKGRRKLMQVLLEKVGPKELPENLPEYLIRKFRFPAHFQAIRNIHFPKNQKELDAAILRLKFEELFFLQLRLLQIRKKRKDAVKGYNFIKVGDFFHRFFKEKLPFELTNAQKRVIKEIRRDLGSGIQMNRLLQGDVGSGKTIVAFISMLMALDNDAQACLLAPTEILSNQLLCPPKISYN